MKKNKYVLYRTLRFIGVPIYKALYNPKIIGMENIPKKGPIILCGNHTNILDIPVLFCITKRVIHFMAKAELFEGIGKWFFNSMGCIPVHRNRKDHASLEEAIKVLNNKDVIGIFPEGTFNKTKDIILPFKYGTVSMASKTNSTIVPFSITGKYKLFSKKSITICIGKPYKLKSDDLEKANEELMEKVKTLIIENREV